jgi:hypothetical protein
MWVMGGKPRTEHIFSGFPPITDVWTGLAVHKERRDGVCGIPCAPLQQSGRDDRKRFAVERTDRRDQEDETYCGE